MSKEGPVVVTIGHMTNDKPNKLVHREHLGGAASYAAVTAAGLGHEVIMLTRGANDGYIKELKEKGVDVYVLPPKDPKMKNKTTTFGNTYNKEGDRYQTVSDIQESITKEDLLLSKFPISILNNATVLVAPVIEEVDISLLPFLSKAKFLGLIAQGNFRGVGPDGKVFQQRWFDGSYLKHFRATALSEEDISFSGKFDEKLLNSIAKKSYITALTKGANGSAIYRNGRINLETGAFTLGPEEIGDLTGAGDVFATVFITELVKESSNLKKSVRTATLFSALKIMKRAGIGIDSIPTKKQFADFKKEYDERIREFYEREKNRKRPHMKMV